MNENIESLVQALREELQEYGEMLALLEHQQECVISRAVDDVMSTVSDIRNQGLAIETARKRREECRLHLALSLNQPADMPLFGLIPLAPHEYRPLLQALLQENNSLLTRIQQRARQNHLLLSRSIEMLQNFVNCLIPSMKPTVYNDSGSMYAAPTPMRSLYEAVG
jgi:hypothetical protein